MSVEGCGYGEALRYMMKPLVDIGKFDELYSPRGLVQTLEMTCRPDGYKPFTSVLPRKAPVEYSAVYRYTLNRGVPKPILTRYFGYVPGTHRAWILVDENWWQGRLIIPGEPKYLSPPWPRGDSLWNAQALLMCEDVGICEGIFSAISAGDNYTALCGKTMTTAQAERLAGANNVRSYTIMLDEGAEKSAYTMARQLEYAGFDGDIRIQYMMSGDPADGVVGGSVAWSWGLELEAAF
jgi:hypothetical protein